MNIYMLKGCSPITLTPVNSEGFCKAILQTVAVGPHLVSFSIAESSALKARWTEKKWSSDRPGLGEKKWGKPVGDWKRELDVTSQHGFIHSFFFQVTDFTQISISGISVWHTGQLEKLATNLEGKPPWKPNGTSWSIRGWALMLPGVLLWRYSRKGYGRESCVPKIYDILLLSIMHADCWVCWKVQRSSASWGWSITSYSRWKGLNRPTWWMGRIFFQKFMRIGKPGRSGSFDEQAGPHPLQGRWDSAPLRES